jgi:phosphate-selective porin OprO/OprP
VPYDNAYLTMGRHGLCHGKGAWQVGIRYAQLDLSDEGIDGGIVQDVTLGLNWFLNPNMKVQWNYVYMDRDAPYGGPDGQTHGFGMRVAHDY